MGRLSDPANPRNGLSEKYWRVKGQLASVCPEIGRCRIFEFQAALSVEDQNVGENFGTGTRDCCFPTIPGRFYFMLRADWLPGEFMLACCFNVLWPALRRLMARILPHTHTQFLPSV